MKADAEHAVAIPTVFEEFVAHRSSSLRRFAYALCGDGATADDLVQEALVRCWGKWERIQQMQFPEAYVRKAIWNLHASWRRRLRVHRQLAKAQLMRVDAAFAIDDRDRLWRFLAALTPAQRAVLVLRHYENLSDPEIARFLDCATATVRSHAARGAAKMRQLLDASETEGGQ